MNIICKAENTASDRWVATASPTSRTAIGVQIGAVCIALGTLLNSLPQLASTGNHTGALLIRIGRKLNMLSWKTYKVQ